MRDVRLLPGAPGNLLAGAPLSRDLRVQPRQPRRDRVGGGAEHHADAALVRPVDDRLQPVQVEPAVLRLPGGPDGLADPDDGKAGLGHQVQVRLEVLTALVLVVVGGPEQHQCDSYSLTAPADSPDCQYRCSRTKATINGMTDSIDPVTTRGSRPPLAPLPPVACDAQELSPTVIG